MSVIQFPSRTNPAFEELHEQLDQVVGDIEFALSGVGDPAARATLLATWERCESAHAALSDGVTATEHTQSAQLLRILVEIQHARAERRPRRSVEPDLEAPAEDLLDALADVQHGHRAQTALYGDLYDRLTPVVSAATLVVVSDMVDSHNDLADGVNPWAAVKHGAR